MHYAARALVLALLLAWATDRAAPELQVPAGQCIENSIGMKLVHIPPGSFAMGSPAHEKGHEPDENLRRVKLTRGFWIGVTEVTQGQWARVMGRSVSHFKGDDLPVDSVSWNDAVAFCRKLSEMEGRTYRLPTEAEWEYACRAGSTGRFAGSETLEELGWYEANSDQRTHPVGSKKPNAWGLYDVHGNVAEWCSDYYQTDYAAEETDPAGPDKGKYRVIRGGSWSSFERGCRCASRSSAPGSYQLKTVGFRVVLDEQGSQDRAGAR